MNVKEIQGGAMKAIQKFVFILLLSLSFSLLAVTYNKLPRDIDDLIQSADIIVIGNIGEVIDKKLFYGYQDGADLLAEQEQVTPFTLGLPLVDYKINVQEVIRSGNEIKDAHDIIFRTFEDHDEMLSVSSIKEGNGKKILFLTKNPDNETYGIISLIHKIDLEKANGEISYSFENKDYEVPFAPKVSPDDLSMKLRQKQIAYFNLLRFNGRNLGRLLPSQSKSIIKIPIDRRSIRLM